MSTINVGVLALQGAFMEHIQLLHQAAADLSAHNTYSSQQWRFSEIRNSAQLAECDALIIPGGESTAISHLAVQSDLLEPLRNFVKTLRRPVWGTCAGLILLSETANRTKINGQELIGGLDVRVNRNHFGRQTESFEADLDLPFLNDDSQIGGERSFRSFFIRAPVVEKILPSQSGPQDAEALVEGTVVAPSRLPGDEQARVIARAEVEVMARLPGSAKSVKDHNVTAAQGGEQGDIVAVRQGNVFGTSFHPELTGDSRIHVWWLKQVVDSVAQRSGGAGTREMS